MRYEVEKRNLLAWEGCRDWEKTGIQFPHKTKVREHLEGLIDREGLDWRVGFELGTRAGFSYRVFDHKEGKYL